MNLKNITWSKTGFKQESKKCKIMFIWNSRSDKTNILAIEIRTINYLEREQGWRSPGKVHRENFLGDVMFCILIGVTIYTDICKCQNSLNYISNLWISLHVNYTSRERILKKTSWNIMPYRSTKKLSIIWFHLFPILLILH